MSKREVKTLDTGLLVRELRDVEWDTLGRCLGLSKGEIKEIEGNYQNTGRRRIEMFDKWLSKEENPSWEKMIAALEDMSVVDLSVFLLAFFTTRSGKSRTGGGFLYN